MPTSLALLAQLLDQRVLLPFLYCTQAWHMTARMEMWNLDLHDHYVSVRWISYGASPMIPQLFYCKHTMSYVMGK